MNTKNLKRKMRLIKDPITLMLTALLSVSMILVWGQKYTPNSLWLSDIEKVFQLTLACSLGSLIGLEREYRKRPAGVRTNALVCIGSTLVMVISFDIFEKYHTIANIDPARLSAQVISGIGFLGAGTIIHNKTSIKGLTTAAGLWVVACIGLAIGAKMYFISITYFVVIYFILHNFGRTERLNLVNSKSYFFEIIANDRSGQIGDIGIVFGKYNLLIKNISIERDKENHISLGCVNAYEIGKNEIRVSLSVDLPIDLEVSLIKNEIGSIEGVKAVFTKKRNYSMRHLTF